MSRVTDHTRTEKIGGDSIFLWSSKSWRETVMTCILYDDVMRCHEDTVMLRNTTGPYRRPMVEVAYGEMIFSLHRGCMGDDSSERVVEVSA